MARSYPVTKASPAMALEWAHDYFLSGRDALSRGLHHDLEMCAALLKHALSRTTDPAIEQEASRLLRKTNDLLTMRLTIACIA